MAKKRVHTLKIRVSFDRPCTVTVAGRSVRNTIKDTEFYPSSFDESDPEEFKITHITRAIRPRLLR
jgi:hypothetical protein